MIDDFLPGGGKFLIDRGGARTCSDAMQSGSRIESANSCPIAGLGIVRAKKTRRHGKRSQVSNGDVILHATVLHLCSVRSWSSWHKGVQYFYPCEAA